MKEIPFFMLCLIAAVLLGIHSASGQIINATMQNVSSRVATTRSAPAAKPVANRPLAPRVVPRPATGNPRIVNSSAPRIVAQPAVVPQRTYSPAVRPSNPKLAVVNTQPGVPGQRAITLDPVTRQTELRTLAAMHQRRGLVTKQANTVGSATGQAELRNLQTMREPRGVVTGYANALDPAIRESESRTLQKMREHRGFGADNQTLATINPQRHLNTRDPEAGSQPDERESPKDPHGKKRHNKKDRIGFDEAFRRHWHEWHDRNWWHNHCETIVFVNTGYYFLDGSYWYPAWGYDPLQTYYDYDGPIYTYSNLLPDEVIANVQTALQNAGYYYGPITGSLSVDTRAAIANFQRDYGLPITGAIDEETVEALGLYDADSASDFQTDQGY